MGTYLPPLAVALPSFSDITPPLFKDISHIQHNKSPIGNMETTAKLPVDVWCAVFTFLKVTDILIAARISKDTQVAEKIILPQRTSLTVNALRLQASVDTSAMAQESPGPS